MTVDLTQGAIQVPLPKSDSSQYLKDLAQLMTTFTIDQSHANANINNNLSQLAESIQHVVQGSANTREPISHTPTGPLVPPPNKWYAVVIGRSPGVYTSTEQLFDQIQGFKESFYRVFDTKPEADAWFASQSLEYTDRPSLIPRDRKAKQTKKNQQKKKARRRKRKKKRQSHDSPSDSSSDSSNSSSSDSEEEIRGTQGRQRSTITGSPKLYGEDPSKGQPGKMYDESIYTGAAVKILSPPHSSAETREDLMEAVPDVGSLPGKLIGAASELNDQVANSIQAIAEHAAQKNNVMLKDTQFRYHSKNTLSKISSLESLVELADEFNKHMEKVTEAAKQAIAEILRNACWSEEHIKAYLESGGIVRLIERSMQYWLQLLLHLKNMHKPTEDWNDRVQIHVDYHAKQLALIRKYAANRSQMVLRVYTYLRDEAAQGFKSLKLLTKITDHVQTRLLESKMTALTNRDNGTISKDQCAHCHTTSIHKGGQPECVLKPWKNMKARTMAKEIARRAISGNEILSVVLKDVMEREADAKK
jgi:hypothetical protein